LEVAAWNLVDPGQRGADKTIEFEFRHTQPNTRVSIQRIDDARGNVLKNYAAMGKPIDPTDEQVHQLNQESELPAPSEERLTDGKLTVKLTPNALVLFKVQP
jgi:xylan 1,4-beta-xylosidase